MEFIKNGSKWCIVKPTLESSAYHRTRKIHVTMCRVPSIVQGDVAAEPADDDPRCPACELAVE